MQSMPPDKDDVEQVRGAVAELTRELTEALTAINAYLSASRLLERLDTPASQANLHDAITKAMGQISRASEIATKLRSIARR
jgi:phosphoglycerate-specific signal transduction histidine kinase